MNTHRSLLVAAVVLLCSAATARAISYTWTGGGGVDTNWSNPANWGGNAPSNGEADVTLVFPSLSGGYASNNDRTGLEVVSLAVTTQLGPDEYLFTGNALTLNGPVTMLSPGSGNPNLVWQIPVTLGGNLTVSTSGRQTRWQGTIDLGANTLTLDAEGDLVMAGTISGSGSLIKNNGSALSITGDNTYTGSTTGNGGALYISKPTALGATSAGTTFTGGFLGFLPGNAFATAEPITFNGGNGIIAYGTPSLTGALTLGVGITVEAFEPSTVVTFNGAVAGAGGLSKDGPGRLVLNASATYGGATGVVDGILQLDTELTSTGALTVRSGARLVGTGASAGTIVAESGALIAPGVSPGSLSGAGLSMSAGATASIEINGPQPIDAYDQLIVSGPVTLGGAGLAISVGYVPSDGQQFTLIDNSSAQPITGTFAALPEGADFHIGSVAFSITYQGGSGNDVVLIAGEMATPTSTAGGATPTSAATSTPTQVIPTPPTATHTGGPTPSPTLSQVPTPTATEIPPLCAGDCDDDGEVEINELILGVNIALGGIPLSGCPAFDVNGDQTVGIAELIQAVNSALDGCTD